MTKNGNMTLDGRTLEEALEATLKQAEAIGRGETVETPVHRVWVAPDVDVANIRSQLGITQAEFAARYGFSLHAVRKWEIGSRRPDAGARTLLWLLGRDHETIDAMLAAVE